ncbi:hypothetical protein DUV77_25665, partial [Salmonella enterica subsp. enterica serovar Newport]|nr:hypothetical protein [Salmonella enterica subsp. enterica serovar Newport]
SAVKKTFETMFYPQVHICLVNLSAHGFIVPGQTEVRICDVNYHVVPDGSGYSVTLPGMSPAGCTKRGGGVCPPDTAGLKADFTGLSGDDIAQLVFHPTVYNITDDFSHAHLADHGPGGRLAYYGELATHFGRTGQNDGWPGDVFHLTDAQQYCESSAHTADIYTSEAAAAAILTGQTTGGPTTAAGALKSLYIGRVAGAFRTGDRTTPVLLVEGNTWTDEYPADRTDNGDDEIDPVHTGNGSLIPELLVMVAGAEGQVATYKPRTDGVDHVWDGASGGVVAGRSFGRRMVAATGWDLSGMYAVTYRPGADGDTRPDKNDMTNRYVSHVNYVTGYICGAELP